MGDLTGREYQHKVRQQAKNRVQLFRERQEQMGFKNITVFLSKRFRDELERLKVERGLSRQAAMEHVFDIYENAIKTDNVTSNDIKPIKDDSGFIDHLEEPITNEDGLDGFCGSGKTDNVRKVENAFSGNVDTPHQESLESGEGGLSLPVRSDEIEFDPDLSHTDDGTGVDVPSWEDKAAYKEYIESILMMWKKEEIPQKEMLERLHENGLKTLRGKDKWNKGTLSKMLKTLENKG